MTALQIRKPLVMLPPGAIGAIGATGATFVICEQARIISDGSFYSIHCLKDGIWLDLYQNAISIVQMRYRGFVSGIDIEIGDFPPK